MGLLPQTHLNEALGEVSDHNLNVVINLLEKEHVGEAQTRMSVGMWHGCRALCIGRMEGTWSAATMQQCPGTSRGPVGGSVR